MTSENNLSAADIAAVTGNRGGIGGFGYGDGSFIWIIILFLFAMFNGGWGNNGNGGMNGMGMYPWLNQQNQMTDGFQNQMLNSNLNGIQNGITAGFGDLQTALCGGFAGVNATINNAQMNDMQNAFAMQTAMNQGFNGLQSQLAQCCCDNRLATCQTQNIVQNEGNMTRFADANNTRDIIESNNQGFQKVMDKLCQLELDGVKNQLAQAQRENVGLQNQVNMAAFRESQANQNALFAQGMNAEVDALYNRLNNCPVPTTPVYGRTPIFTCNGNQGCGCNGNSFYN